MNSFRRPSLLPPEALLKIKDLYLLAKGVVDGFMAGHHPSSHRGFSLEFAEHRKYVPGDEVKHLDWKVWARTEKYFVKCFESETHMRVHMVLDKSASMGFGSPEKLSKLTYSSILAAALVYLVSRYQDLIGLVLYDEQLTQWIPPRSGKRHTQQLIQMLSSLKAGGKTNTATVLQRLSERLKKRSLIVLISDLFDSSDDILKNVAQFKHAKHDVVVFHVLDNAEWVFPYQDAVSFVDMESSNHLTVNPLSIRAEYLKGIEALKKKYQTALGVMNVDYVPVNTLFPFEFVLNAYLSSRKKR